MDNKFKLFTKGAANWTKKWVKSRKTTKSLRTMGTKTGKTKNEHRFLILIFSL